MLLENELAFCIADAYPGTPGHSLVIPRRHVADGLALHQPEWNAAVELLKQRREQLSAPSAAVVEAAIVRLGYNRSNQPPFMAFWWVNHKQTYRQETDGGYIWSPKTNANGARNVSYDNLNRCQRGDVVFSYAKGKISQIALVETAAETAQKPLEFGSAGDNWNQEG